MSRHCRCRALLVIALIAGVALPLMGQQRIIVSGGSSGGAAAVFKGKVPPGSKPGQPVPSRSRRSSSKKPSSSSNKGKKPGSKSGSASKSVKPIVRASAPKYKPDPKALLIKPGKDGRVKFSFRGHKWDDVIDWYGIITNQATDWLELPGDYVNISTARPMTLDETRGMLNQQLLSRGYTILKQEGFLMVVNIKKLNPAMVPRITTSDLQSPKLAKYDFVRLSITLDTVVASEIIKELEKIKSPNGKLIALESTNRIEAMDAVINLREIHRIVMEEQAPENTDRRSREFQLNYTRAKEMKATVEEFIGKSTTATPRVSSSRSRSPSRGMIRSSSSRSRRPTPVVAKPKVVTSIVADERRNTLICHAPPNKMALIARYIKFADQPVANDSLEKNLLRMKTYRLSGVDPATVVETLSELGGLNPMTRLKVDEKNSAIVAYASLYDQMMIQKVVDKLDGSGRRFEVISLRRHAADELAGTIEQMMGGEKEKNNRRRSYDWYDYGWYDYGRSRRNNDTKKDKFRVSADIEHNLLLLWCNEIELKEVDQLLAKLGERRSGASGGTGSTTRVLSTGRGKDRIEFLKKLQQMWNSQGGKMIIPSDDELKRSEKEFLELDKIQEENRKQQKPANQTQPPTKETKTTISPKKTVFTAFPGQGDKQKTQQPAADTDKASKKKTAPQAKKQATPSDANKKPAPLRRRANPTESSEFQRIFGNRNQAAGRNANPNQPTQTRPRGIPPVIISVGPNGDLVLNSNDPRTLDRLERIFEQMAPRRKSYKVFYLKNAPASWVSLNIEEFFEDKDEEESRRFRRWSWRFDSSNEDDKKSRLSKRKKLKFVWDNDTNTILVQNADADQLKTIADLIKLYDVPEPKSSQKTRITKLFPIKYSRATLIAETIKDAYRDLLSANDKALQGANNQKKESRSSGRTYITNFGGGPRKQGGTRIAYKGKLSIGVNELTNSLVVSVEGDQLLKVVGGMIEQLDQAARTVNAVSVVQLQGGVNSQQLHATLAKILGVEGPRINNSSNRTGRNGRNGRNFRGNNGGYNRGNNNSNRRSSNSQNSNRSNNNSTSAAVPARR